MEPEEFPASGEEDERFRCPVFDSTPVRQAAPALAGGECSSPGGPMASLAPDEALQALPSAPLLDWEGTPLLRSRSASVSSTGSSGRLQLRQRVAQLMACVEDVSSDDEIHEEVSRTLDEAFLLCGKKQKEKPRQIRLHLVTWNVGTASPPPEVTSLLLLNSEGPAVDMYVIGLQEVNSKVVNFLSDLAFDDPWSIFFMAVLSPLGYVKVSSIRMQGLLLLIFAKQAHLPFIRDIQSQFTRTGLYGYWGNKGGVASRLSLYGHMVCFLNCHLPAHLENAEQRLDDFEHILEMQQFAGETVPGILDHDILFWFGDLNFRIEDYGLHFIRESINGSRFSLLWEKDQDFIVLLAASRILTGDTLLSMVNFEQLFNDVPCDGDFPEMLTTNPIIPTRRPLLLGVMGFVVNSIWESVTRDIAFNLNMAKKKERFLQEFREGPLKFKPTYKFDLYSNEYDTRGQKMLLWFNSKKRKPAWTDRILWRARPRVRPAPEEGEVSEEGSLSVSLRCYASHMSYGISDHKPVTGTFDLELKPLASSPLVTLRPVGEWSAGHDVTISYSTLPEFPSSAWDWIGLYRVAFRHPNDYVMYAWVQDNEISSGEDARQVYLGAEELPAAGGEFLLGYYSHALQCMVGISRPFQIQPNRTSAEKDPLWDGVGAAEKLDGAGSLCDF